MGLKQENASLTQRLEQLWDSCKDMLNNHELQELTRGTSSPLLSTDCGERPSTITDGVRKMLVERDPVQVKDIEFPIDAKVFGNANSSLAGDQGCSDWQNLTDLTFMFV
ncbi:hypothetical protein PR048_016128 [Dryococelus australis]|uniref:Uncharacterized protein n=1 Tax=Dryococelus australis TaxID=614101 RepID=A0ABQ9HJF9_9NEOP|nr:hypothetical protein PR048_016128 [Dryococelus australis]